MTRSARTWRRSATPARGPPTSRGSCWPSGAGRCCTPESIDLGAVVAGIQKMLGRVIGEHVHLVTDLQPDAWLIRADRGQVEQVLVNLAVNARDAMPAGGGSSVSTANVRVSEAEARRHPEGAARRLRPAAGGGHRRRDDPGGPGPGLRALLHHQGSGQGHRAGALHGLRDRPAEPGVRGGDQRAGSRGPPSTSTCPGTTAGRSRRRRAREGTGAGRGAGEVVLVVEDEEQVRSLVVSQLTARGYAVLSAADGREALRIAEQPGPSGSTCCSPTW